MKDKKESGEQNDKGSQDDESDLGDSLSEDNLEPAKVFNEKIQTGAGLGDSPGDVIAHFSDIPLIVPRGKYSFDMY